MVKKFRRAAAGLEEQLPSDLRPPPVLKMTCDYLFDNVIDNAARLEKVHHFVWDRTRAIRNDFSIQQITKPEDLRIAIDCYERIARFHIVSLHQLAVQPKPYDKYDPQQEREQLDRTLLSLMQYYDDSRGRIELQNEMEFRAYCVIFQLQDPTPDLEDRVQTWPRNIVLDNRVQRALEVYAAACNTIDAQGPLKARASHLTAQQDWQRFWTLVESSKVSYLMACVAEIYFNLVRRTVLNALLRAFRQSANKADEDWTVPALCHALAFDIDHEDEAVTFCEQYGFAFRLRHDGTQYLDLTSIKDRTLPEPEATAPKQLSSKLVEDKRLGRTLPAVINGLTVDEAERRGMVIDEQTGIEELDADEMDEDAPVVNGGSGLHESDSSDPDPDTLFMPEGRTDKDEIARAHEINPLTNGTSNVNSDGFSFGKPSGGMFGAPSGSAPKPTEKPPKPQSSLFDVVNHDKKITFDFGAPSSAAKDRRPTIPNTQDAEPESRLKAAVGPQNPAITVENAPNPTNSLTNGSQSAEKAGTLGLSGRMSNSSEQGLAGAESQPASLIPTGPLFSTSRPVAPEPAADTREKSAFSFTQSAGPTTSAPSQQSSHDWKAQPAPANNTSPSFTQSPTSPRPGNRKTSLPPEHRPKKPSPLSQSHSFDDDSSSLPPRGSEFKPASEPLQDFFSAEQSKTAKQDFTETKASLAQQSAGTQADFAKILGRIAEEITTDPVAGFLKQYVDFAVQQLVQDVERTVDDERANAKADQFRRDVLLHRYSKRWRDLFWGKRREISKTKRRERARKRLDESRSERQSESLKGGSSIVEGEMDGQGTVVEGVAPFGATKPHQEPGQALDHEDGADGTRSQALQRENLSTTSHKSRHKRFKSTSHLDDHGRVTKPALADNPNADILKRSSFLGFSAAGSTINRSTTRSTYFRLKALGIHSPANTTTSRGTKRRRSESQDSSSLQEALSFRSPSALDSSPSAKGTDKVPLPPLSSTPSGNDANDALFARLKAARESLQESTSYYKTESANREGLGRITASPSSSDSASLIRARSEARLRASQAASQAQALAPSRDVPAYRLRESRFVPREQYGRAIERATEIRASRSREASRPESRNEASLPANAKSPLSRLLQAGENALLIDAAHDDKEDRLPGINGDRREQPPASHAVQGPAWGIPQLNGTVSEQPTSATLPPQAEPIRQPPADDHVYMLSSGDEGDPRANATQREACFDGDQLLQYDSWYPDQDITPQDAPRLMFEDENVPIFDENGSPIFDPNDGMVFAGDDHQVFKDAHDQTADDVDGRVFEENNGLGSEGGETLHSEAEADDEESNENPGSSLAEFDSQLSTEAGIQDLDEDERFEGEDEAPNGHAHYYADDEEVDGDTDDGEEDDEETEGSEGSEGEDDGRVHYWNPQKLPSNIDPRAGQWRHDHAPSPPALQGVGDTAEEAIELSD